MCYAGIVAAVLPLELVSHRSPCYLILGGIWWLIGHVGRWFRILMKLNVGAATWLASGIVSAEGETSIVRVYAFPETNNL